MMTASEAPLARRSSRSNPATSTRRRVVGYVRVSTDKQAESGLSLEAQRSKLEAWATLYDVELVAVEVDAGVSAATLDRPALARVLVELDAGRVDAVLVAKLDRLTRSTRDLGDLLDRAERRRWGILSVAENLDTSTAAGRLVVSVLGAVAQWEREAIGERTAAALAAKAARGELVGAAPIGTRADDAGRLVVDELEAAAVATIRELRAAGLSIRAIVDELEARGVASRGGRWHATTVARVLARAAGDR
jgi:DNA invertase Pin-like site-specific DNA recombinase